MSYAERCRQMIVTNEGCIPHMYLDTNGYVTVAVGNMLPSFQAAQRLAFVRREDGKAATPDEIKADFTSVAQRPKRRQARWYKQYTKLDMVPGVMIALLDKRVAGFETVLHTDFPAYNTYPEAAKLGLIDMTFNLGIVGLTRKFPTFTRAAMAQDWETCARECARHGVSDERNEATKALFLEAVQR